MDKSTDDILGRVRGEFLEMPGLRLTEAQARRLWHLDPGTCTVLLNVLVTDGFLFRSADGAYMRIERAQPARAGHSRHRINAA